MGSRDVYDPSGFIISNKYMRRYFLQHRKKGGRIIEKNWHALDVRSLQQEFKTDMERGLNTEEADARLKTFGPNALEEKPPRSFFAMIFDQLKEVLVLILIAAALISAFIGEWRDSIVILIIVVLNGTIRYN